jgi:catechol 2,3-dioxygenase-like lactoylglutathione lyase family enzyme
MPSVVDLVENHLLLNLTDPDTYAEGVELANLGAVEFDEFGPLHARARVRDGEIFVADLRLGPGKLIWSCSEPGGARGALCRHCVAAAVETRRRASARASGVGSVEDADVGLLRRGVQSAPTDQAAITSWARHPAPLAPPVELATPVDEEALVISEPTRATQAEPAAAAVSDEGQSALLEQLDQPASRVLMPSTPQEPASPTTVEPTPGSERGPEARPEPDAGGVTGIHAIVFTPAVPEVRAFFRDALGLPNVDAGDGWLIFALPPAELAVHPADVPSHWLYLMCDDIEATLASFERKGIEVRRPVREEGWGWVTEIVLPGGTDLAIYQPKHPSPLARPREPHP